MQHELGDDYIRRVGQFIRTYEQNLAEGGFGRRRIRRQQGPSIFNPISWVGAQSASEIKPVILRLDQHHLFYLLIRIQSLGINVGNLDLKLDDPARPTTYINFVPSDRSDTLSLSSIRSSLSAVSNFSLGGGWWGRAAPLSLDSELKYIFSSFTKLPALCIHAPSPKLIRELAKEPPADSAIPLDSFRNLQCLVCSDVDPRTLLGWDRVAESVRSLTIKRSGLADVTDVFINLVADDLAQREGHITTKRKRFTLGPSSRSSFYGTRLPDTVPEISEDNTSTNDTPSANSELSSLKWAFLKHLCLSENSLTFFPIEPLSYLTSLTHLDLSSNLLVSVPTGLSSLYNLVSLDLSENMIDSVLGIYQRLGQILYLNVSHNRLESICGLERIPALERIDLRNNLIEGSSEVGRLATLPNIAEVWIEGNPLEELEESYRIRCFDYFWKEGKSILLDGSPAGLYEKQFLTKPVAEQMKSSRPISSAPSPPAVAVGKVRIPDEVPIQISQVSPESSSPASVPTSPRQAAALLRGRKRKNKRIVEFDGDDNVDSGRAWSINVDSNESTKRSSLALGVQAADLSPAPVSVAIAPLGVNRMPRHRRSQTEGNLVDITDDTPHLPTSSTTGSLRTKGSIRRSRTLASAYDPSRMANGEGAKDTQKESEALRAKIEALRTDMGDKWLNALHQSHSGSLGVAS